MNFLDLLKEKVLVLDGGGGTELQKYGKYENCMVYNVKEQEIVESVHESYLRAGADILETNTFTGTRYALQKVDQIIPKDKLVRKYNLPAVFIAKKFAKKALVAGSIGPTGAIVAPPGRYRKNFLSREETKNLFKEQAEVLKEGGVDFFLIETMIDLNEALLALKAAKNTGLMTAVSFNLEKRNGYKTPFGNSLEEIIERCEEADIIGTNCISGILQAVEIVEEMRKLTVKPLIAYPNAGKPTSSGQYPESAEYIRDKVMGLIEAGANIVGGCCGTTPAHIKAFREVVDEHNRKRQSQLHQ